MATAYVFDSRTDALVKVSMFLKQKLFRPEEDSNPQLADSCPMLLTFELSFELSGPDICYPMLSNTGSDGIDIL